MDKQWPGSVRVTVAGSQRRSLPRFVRVIVIALTAVLVSAGVVWGIHALGIGDGTPPAARPSARDARAAAGGEGAVAGSSRLALVGPQIVLDTRTRTALGPGELAPLALPALPQGSTAVLLEVSLLAAAGPGAVTVVSGAQEIPALRLPRAGAMTTTTIVVPAGADRELQVRTEGGGHVLVSLLAAFEPAQDATAGRLVPVAATRVLDLVPATDGKDAVIDLANVPVLPDAAQVGAVLVHVAADVGRNGGLVTVDGIPGGAKQSVFWAATTDTDRTRTGFLLVPVTGSKVDLHYEAGTQLQADLVGYVTGDAAPRERAGLLVPVPPGVQTGPVAVGAGKPEKPKVVPPEGLAAVPADRVAAMLIRVGATGDGAGGVTVFAPGSAEPGVPTLTAAPGAQRFTLTVAGIVDGAVQIGAAAGASVSLSPQAVILRG